MKDGGASAGLENDVRATGWMVNALRYDASITAPAVTHAPPATQPAAAGSVWQEVSWCWEALQLGVTPARVSTWTLECIAQPGVDASDEMTHMGRSVCPRANARARRATDGRRIAVTAVIMREVTPATYSGP